MVNVLDQLSVILARPIYPVNIGSVARLCTNFGVKNLNLVQPQCKIDVSDARKFATIRGQEILNSARIENNLADVVKDTQVVIGFTARVGYDRVPTIGVGKIGELLKAGASTALLFGSEDNGLAAHEVSLCTHICQIPTSTVKTSLNLSHCVAIVLARVFEDLSQRTPEKRYEGDLATSSELTMLVKKMNANLGAGERFAGRIERLIKKSNMTSSEVRLIYFLLGTTFAKKPAHLDENQQTPDPQMDV